MITAVTVRKIQNKIDPPVKVVEPELPALTKEEKQILKKFLIHIENTIKCDMKRKPIFSSRLCKNAIICIGVEYGNCSLNMCDDDKKQVLDYMKDYPFNFINIHTGDLSPIIEHVKRKLQQLGYTTNIQCIQTITSSYRDEYGSYQQEDIGRIISLVIGW